MERKGGNLLIPRQEHYEIDIYWRFHSNSCRYNLARFTPDLLSVILVTAAQAKWNCSDSSKKMFESRLFFVDKLIDMGTQMNSLDPPNYCDRAEPKVSFTYHSNDISWYSCRGCFVDCCYVCQGKVSSTTVRQIDRGISVWNERLNARKQASPGYNADFHREIIIFA